MTETVVSRSRVVVRVALRLFGPAPGAAPKAADARLVSALEGARIRLLPEAYVALGRFGTSVAAVVSLGIATILAVALSTAGVALPILAVVAFGLPAGVAVATWSTFQLYPELAGRARRSSIERNLPYAVNYMAAMASAGLRPQEMMEDLASQTVYGAIAEEAAWIHRDIALLGRDLPRALRDAENRTPSPRLQDFLSGIRNALVAGGDVSTYLAAKADQYMHENRELQNEFLESLGVLAESYVTVVVAGPLFLLIMLSVMLVVGGGIASTSGILFAIVFLALPVAHATFAAVIASSAPGD